MISIVGLNKADVLAASYNASKPQGLGFLHYNPEPMSREEAQAELDRSRGYFDYLNGRVMKVGLQSDTEFHEGLYDRDNGTGAAQRAIEALRKTQDVNAEEIEHQHLENTRHSAMLVNEHIFDKSDVERRGKVASVHLGLDDFADQLKPKLDDILDEE